MYFSICNAQDTLQVLEVEKPFSKGTHIAFSVVIPQAKLRDVQSGWKKYQREKNKADYNDNKGEFCLRKPVIPAITSDSIIIYSILTETTNHINLTAFITKDDSLFLNSSNDQQTAIRFNTFIRNFAVHEYRNAVTNELTFEQKKLSELATEIEDLEKDNDRMEKKIKSNEREIDKIESEIKSNLNEQELNEKNIYNQQKIIATFLEKSDLKTEQEKKLKELEKTRKKLQKENESMHEDIDELESDNKTLKKKIDANNEENIPLKKKDKDKQRLIVAQVEVKLKGIQ